MNDKGKRICSLLLVSVLAIILLILFSSSTSPLFDIVYSDYYNNPSSTGIFIGKIWSKEVLPYRDYYVANGPLFYFLQKIGWSLAGRIGIFILQVICMIMSLSFLHKIFNYFVDWKNSNLLILVTMIPLAATLNGGNSPYEYCIMLSIIGLYMALQLLDKSTILWLRAVLFGVLIGSVVLIQITAGGILYGIAIFFLIYYLKEKRYKDLIKNVVFCWMGCCAIVIPFIVYFNLNGCLNEMFYGTFLHPIKLIWAEAFTADLLLHKLIKSIPAVLLFSVTIHFYKAEKNKYGLLISVSVVMFLFLITGQGYWMQYMPTVISVPMIIIVLLNNLENPKKQLLTCACVLVLFFWAVIPLKRYFTFVKDTDLSGYRTLISEVENVQMITGESRLFMVNVPAFVYIETDSMPDYYYFVQQLEYNKVDSSIQEKVTNYMINDCRTVIAVIEERGGAYMQIGNYYLMSNYTCNYDRKMLYVYQYFENVDELHDHETE